MYNTNHVYDLSFRAPGRVRKKPHIIFTITNVHFAELNIELQRQLTRFDAATYIGHETQFTLPYPDLFGHTEFGYGKCGLVLTKRDSVHLCIELSEQALHEVVLTIHVLTSVLNCDMQNAVADASNQHQLLELETQCRPGYEMYGHSVAGNVSPRLVSWLRNKGEQAYKCRSSLPELDAVGNAMRHTWRVINQRTQWKSARFCGCTILRDGRFILTCPGNACDVAMYFDSRCDPEEPEEVRFSCHNLDQPRQQLTLVAGLAKLCELARRNE